MLGSWEINVNTNGMPQKVATAFGKLSENLMGAEYEIIAYLGSQVVNGTNHAVLAKQTILTGRDTENIVVLIFNEKPSDMEATLVSIERVVEGGGKMGGVHLSDNPGFEIPTDAMADWQKVFNGYVGANVEPFAFLGSQVVNGVNQIFAATVTPVYPDAKTQACIVIVNASTKDVIFKNILGTKHDEAFGYSFTWQGLGSPLGEWP